MIYEKEQDRENERILAKALEEKYGGQLHQTNSLHRIDYLWFNEKGPKWLEIKKREIPSTKFDTIFIPLHKLQYANELKQATNYDSYLVVWWTDMIGVTKLSDLKCEEDFTLDYKARNGRIPEPVIHLSRDKFKSIEVQLNG